MSRHLGKGDGLCHTCRAPATVHHILWECQHTQPLWANWRLPLPHLTSVQDCLLPIRALPASTFLPLCAHGVVALQRWLNMEPRVQVSPQAILPVDLGRSRAQP
eukprot:5167541-Amphidinium_carterae.1